MNAMKAGLHKFYITKRESIYSLLKISLIWMSSFLVMHLIGSFAIGNFNDVAYLDSQKDSNSAEVYASMLLIFCSNIPLNFYAIMTVKNIDFKLYICYIFLGNEMIDSLKGWSIFLVGRPKIVYEENVLDEDSDSSSSDLSPSFRKMLTESYGDANIDYDSGFDTLYVSKKLIRNTEKVTSKSFW